MFDNLTNGEEKDNQAISDNNLLDKTVNIIYFNLVGIIDNQNGSDFNNCNNEILSSLSNLNDDSTLLQNLVLDSDLESALSDLDSFYYDGYKHKDSGYHKDMRVVKSYVNDYKNGNQTVFLA